MIIMHLKKVIWVYFSLTGVTQAAGRGHTGWRDLGDAAERYRIWAGWKQRSSSAAGQWNPSQSQWE